MTPSTRGFRDMKSVVVRFAGDSGDGMQIVGERFTDTSVTVPNAIATFPDYPAELRAPIGTIAGGYIADRLGATDRRWFLWVPMWGKFLGAPLFIAALLAPTVELSLLFYFPGITLALWE